MSADSACPPPLGQDARTDSPRALVSVGGPPPPSRAKGALHRELRDLRAGSSRYKLLGRVINLLDERPVAIDNLIEGDDLL